MNLAVGFQPTVGVDESFPVASATIEFSRGFSTHGWRIKLPPSRQRRLNLAVGFQPTVSAKISPRRVSDD
jgi:hypothetical protein